jgi:HAD superfamily hydrolase (TIGR01509 family)
MVNDQARANGRVRGVILDVDGTLVDSNGQHAEAWHEAFRESGVDGGGVERIRRLIGMGSDKLLPEAAGIDQETDEGERLSARRAEIFRERYLDDVRPTPGSAELVRELQARGMQVVVASSARPDELSVLLERAGTPWLADDATSADEVDASKPEPDVVEAALRELGLPPGEVVMIGDTPYDIEAATRAGVGVIAVRTGGWDSPDLADALAVYDDPADLLAHLDESPLAG